MPSDTEISETIHRAEVEICGMLENCYQQLERIADALDVLAGRTYAVAEEKTP
jgi:hypothetical protein